MFSCFSRIPTCDWQTQTDGRRPIAYASIASCGKNWTPIAEKIKIVKTLFTSQYFENQSKYFYGHPLKCYVSYGGMVHKSQPKGMQRVISACYCANNQWEFFSHGNRGYFRSYLLLFRLLPTFLFPSWSFFLIPIGFPFPLGIHSHGNL